MSDDPLKRTGRDELVAQVKVLREELAKEKEANENLRLVLRQATEELASALQEASALRSALDVAEAVLKASRTAA